MFQLTYANHTTNQYFTNFNLGTYFYNAYNFSFGFAENSSINLSKYDTNFPSSNYRLSWLNDGFSNGSNRLGNLSIDLTAYSYCKVMYSVLDDENCYISIGSSKNMPKIIFF